MRRAERACPPFRSEATYMPIEQQSVATDRLRWRGSFASIRAMRTLLALSLVFAAACGSKSSTPTTTPTGGGEGSGSAAMVLPDVPFEKLDHDQQIEFMKVKVVP